MGECASSLLVAGLLFAVGADEPNVQRRMDDAREHFMAGYYRFAFEEFKELAESGDEDMATSAGVAMADCQMAWGDYSGALETLQTIANGPPPEGGGSPADWPEGKRLIWSNLWNAFIQPLQRRLRLGMCPA